MLARDRYGYTVLQHRLEEASARLRNLETLGEGRTVMDYEALRTAHASHRDKLDERDRELEKLRHKYARFRAFDFYTRRIRLIERGIVFCARARAQRFPNIPPSHFVRAISIEIESTARFNSRFKTRAGGTLGGLHHAGSCRAISDEISTMSRGLSYA